jgi:hypothetical protein|tara:strand:- start:153 stop:623 length:471 start_codon:yes stop_codon:yes gene_type:complete
MTKPMDMVYMFIKTELAMRASGKTISNMVSVRRFGPITVNTKVITPKVKNMVRVYISGKMAPCTTVTGSRIGLKDTVNTNGKTAVNTLENGKTTTCMVKVFTLGPTAEDMMDNTKWTKSTVLESINGQITEFTKETGSMESNMEEANIFSKTETSK